MKNKKKKGFTLIELIVVIAIIGILGAIAIPRLTGFTATAKTKADLASAKTIKTAAYTAIAAGEIATAAQTLTIGTLPGTLPGTVINQAYFPGSTAPTKSNGGSFTITEDANGDITVN